MRPLLHLFALLLAALGCALPAGTARVACEPGGDGVLVADEDPRWPEDPGGFRRYPCAFGSGSAIEVVPDVGRPRNGPRAPGTGPPANPPREHAPRCAPPRPLAEVGPFLPGESPFGQGFLRVNGAANANGARA